VDLNAENTAIVLDSTADFPEATERFANWRVVPLYVRFGDESLRDFVDLEPHAFYERLRSAPELPTTSQPTPADFAGVYEELGGYARIYSLHVSAKLSGTFESARTASLEQGDRVRLVDTETASAGITLLGLAIQRRLERGTTDDELEELIGRFRRDCDVIFTVDTLEFLAKGGRIGKAASMAGQLLHIKPILSVEDGVVEPVKRVRGNQKAFAEFVKRFDEGTTDEDGWRIGIAHADAPERADALVQMVERERPKARIDVVTMLGAVVGTHAGPGAVGFFWFRDA
jgi:DegV family protein with EDD domain